MTLAGFERLETSLRELPPWQRLAFALGICERMYPNYVLFSELSGFGEARVLRTALDAAWDTLVSRSARVDFGLQLEKLEPMVPDPDAFDSFGAKPALDAAMAVVCALEIAQGDDDAGAPIAVSKLSRSTVDAYLEVTEASVQDADTLTVEELGFQQRLLEAVLACRQWDKDAIRVLRRSARNDGVSNIGISLE